MSRIFNSDTLTPITPLNFQKRLVKLKSAVDFLKAMKEIRAICKDNGYASFCMHPSLVATPVFFSPMVFKKNVTA
jgi:hypothetical protein